MGPPLPSYVSEQEAAELERLARDRLVLELGTWFGYSTLVMARTALRVWTVDWHKGDRETGDLDTLWAYFDQLDASGFRPKVVSTVGRFEDVCPYLRPQSFGLIFLDGRHDRESSSQAASWALELVAEQGVIAAHDWGHFEVAEAMLPILGPPNWVLGSLAVFGI